ncbi:MAG TPA: class I SAM-dependent methyltransferase [Verrucomicrobiales bacterium]|nr:class I SAM-dependent methyltransferase [Verrucomicrobiales bacterium]
MRREFVGLLQCPRCGSGLQLEIGREDALEARQGTLICQGMECLARYGVADGIAEFAVGFDEDAVRSELAYQDSSYHGDARLIDEGFIGRFPDSLPELWPHTRHFGPDFRGLIRELGVGKGHRVLDIGTAACWSCRLMAERGAEVTALDVSGSPYYGLRAAEIQFRTHGVFFERVLESMTHLPFRDGVFDFVTCNASLHHTPDLDRTLREFGRVLKPGGEVGVVNEVFTGLRRRLFPKGNHAAEPGAHHDIRYRELRRSARYRGLEPRYRLTAHAAHRIRDRSRLAAAVLGRLPWFVRQLDSAVVVMRKSASA